MRKVFIVLTLVIGLMVPLAVSASPLYLTIEGTVEHDWQIYGNKKAISASGISVGDTLKYVVMLDTEEQGSFTNQQGNTYDSPGKFYTSLYSGALQGNTRKQQNWGELTWSGFYTQTGNEFSNVKLNSWSTKYGELGVGSSIDKLSESSWVNGKNVGINLNDVVVTSVSNSAPTPIGASGLLLVGGLGVVGFIRRRMSKAS